MTFVFYGVYWKTNPAEAEIWYGNPKTTNIERLKIEIGNEFNIKILEDSYCIGTEKGRGKWISCKQRREADGEKSIGSGYRLVTSEEATDRDKNDSDVMVFPDGRRYKQCYRCSTTEFFTCRMTCVGDVCIPTSDRAKELCDPPNTSIYLTYVGGEYKVGVSLGIPRRWIEQGSDLATVIATAPGLEARRLEQYIAQELDLKLQVRSNIKMKNLQNKDLQDARKKMELLINKVQPMISKILGDVKGVTHRKPSIQEFSEFYGNYQISTPIQEFEVSSNSSFGGQIIGIKGSILIVRQNSYHYAINLKRMVSREFEFLDNPPQIETQSYLDQWF